MQRDLRDYFNLKKVKLNEEPIRLITPTFTDNEDQDDEEQDSGERQRHTQMHFHSPFSQFKTMGFSTRSDNIQSKAISRLNFTTVDPSPCFFPEGKKDTEIRPIPQLPPQKMMKNGTLDRWMTLRPKNDSWPYLPKELVHRIFSYLHLRDCATTALVCHYWKVCYHNIYFNYSFLREFDSDRYSAGEMATVFKKAGSKMKHIRKIKEILKGQRLGPLMLRARVSANLSANSERHGSLLESFRLEPKRAGLSSSVFLTDKALLSICSDSNHSLQFISLASCQFVTSAGFEGLRRCTNLQYINIQNNSHLTDSSLRTILKEIPGLHTLMLAKCSALTTETLATISQYCHRLERLDLGSNPQIRLEKIKLLARLKYLGSLSLRTTSVTNQEIQDALISMPQLHSFNLCGISIEQEVGCLCINDLTLALLRQHGKNLTRLNIACVSNISEQELYLMVEQLFNLKVLLVNNNLYSTRIEKLIASRQ